MQLWEAGMREEGEVSEGVRRRRIERKGEGKSAEGGDVKRVGREKWEGRWREKELGRMEDTLLCLPNRLLLADWLLIQ